MKVNKFAQQLREIREEEGLSQTQLAKALNFSQSTIAKWESGDHEPELDIVIKVAKFFKCSTDYLLGVED